MGHQVRVSSDIIFISFVESGYVRCGLLVSHLTNSVNECLANAFSCIKIGIHLLVLLLNLGLAGMDTFLDE